MSLASLRSLLARETEELAENVNLCNARLARRGEFAATGAEDILADSLAACLHSFYTGLESLLETIAGEFAELPQGAHWHKKLLTLMSTSVPGVRPPVLSATTIAMLDEFRAFRHLFRNLYTHSLRPDRVFELTAALGPVWHHLQADLAAFTDSLEKMDGPGRA